MGPAAVRYAMKPVGEPDAGNRHVRFDERGWETERLAQPQATALILDSTRSIWATLACWRREKGPRRPHPALRSPGNANRSQSSLTRRNVTAPATRAWLAASASSARSSRSIASARPPADEPNVPTGFSAAITAAPASGAK